MTKIAIIDDDNTTISIMERVIRESIKDVSLFTANDGEEGLKLIRQVLPDIIILDVCVPKLTGYEICELVKKDDNIAHIPVLMITGMGQRNHSKVKSLNTGANAFIHKPLDLKEFEAQLKALVRLKVAEDKLKNQRDILKIDVKIKEHELKNNFYELKALFNSLIEIMATAIDLLTIYEYKSSHRVALLMKKFVEYINNNEKGAYAHLCFTDEDKENLYTAAWLHDIGKILLPISVVNKKTRLGDSHPIVMQRLETIYYWIKLSGLDLLDKLELLKEMVIRYDNPKIEIGSDSIKQFEELANLQYVDSNGEYKNWLTSYELNCLSIKRGSLTDEEREKVKDHARLTDLLLKKLHLPHSKIKIREWCSSHHELLDGSGYWRGLSGDEISIETRILTIVDMFEAMISEERGYKKKQSVQEALDSIQLCAEMGKLDKELVNLFLKSKVWINLIKKQN